MADMRAIAKMHIRLGVLSAPVKLYKATDDSEAVKLNMLHGDCGGAVGYAYFCKKCGKEHIAQTDITKGFCVDEGKYVQISKEDIAKVKVKSDKIIELESFVPAGQIPLAYYERPMFMSPDGDVAVKTYALIREAMTKTNTVGIGKVTLRDREEVVVITPHGNSIAMFVVRYHEEVRSVKSVPGMDKMDGVQVNKDHLKLALQLVQGMSKDFADVEMVDHYNIALKAMISAKVDGKDYSVTTVPDADTSVDTMAALQASLDLLKNVDKAKAKVKSRTDKKRKSA